MTAKRANDSDVLKAMHTLHEDYLDLMQPKKRYWREFSGGVVRGLGMAIGGTIIFGVLGYVLGKFLIIPGAADLYDTIKHDAAGIQQNFAE